MKKQMITLLLSMAVCPAVFGVLGMSHTASDTRQLATESPADKQDTVYQQHFDTKTDMLSMTIIDANNDGQSWQYDSDKHRAMCIGMSGHASDDWLLTANMQLSQGKVYELTYQAAGGGGSSTEYLSVAWGDGNNPDSYALLSKHMYIPFNNSLYKHYLYCSESSEYRVGFHAESPAAQYGISIDDIVVREVADGKAPGAVRLLRATAAANEAKQVTVTFHTPDKAANGSQLPALSKITIARNGKPATTLDNVKPGSSQSWTDTTPDTGKNEYTVTCYNEAGPGIPATADTYVGEVKPDKVSNIRLVDQNGTYLLTWSAPTKGVSQGAFHPEHCKYNVYEAGQYGPGELYKGNISDTCLAISETAGEQHIAGYYVSAVNEGGESEKAMSNSVLLGSAYHLPVIQEFDENFMAAYYYDHWTDSQGHLWWRSSDDDNTQAKVVYSSSLKSLVYVLDGYNSASYNSGKIEFAHAVSPTLTFNYELDKNSQMEVIAVTPGQHQVPLQTYVNRDKKDTEWQTGTIDLSPLKAYKYATLQFKCSADEETSYPALDNIRIIDATEHNLYATLSVSAKAFAGQQNAANVVVSNFGTEVAEDYTVHLYLDGNEVAMHKATTPLQPMASDTVRLQYNPLFSAKQAQLYAMVEYAPDQYTGDNTTPTTTVDVVRPATKAINDLSAQSMEKGNQLTWSAVKSETTTTTDDMESYPAFYLPGDGHYLEYEYNIGPWYNYDEDQNYTIDIPGYTFPWEEEGFAWIVFNRDSMSTDGSDETATPPSQMPIFAAHSGNQFLASFSMKSDYAPIGNQVSDWLISPRLSGDAQTVTFWVKTLNTSNGTATFQVRYSTTDSTYTNFSHLLLSKVCSERNASDWQKVSIALPDGATFFAIRNTTPIDINQIVMVDDISYTTGTGTVKGYNVYRDGKQLTTTAVPTFTDTDGGEHVYNVTVVYNTGESSLSNTATTHATGIDRPTANHQVHATTVYSLNGRKRQGMRKGVNIIRYSNGETKKIMVK